MNEVFVSVKGSGQPIVYLHGFLETNEIWSAFTEQLPNYKHFLFDLPGFGKSDALPFHFSLTDVATQVVRKTEQLGLQNFHLVGHSLGGYVVLAILETFPEKLKSITLFHSTPLPDTTEKKENRTKAISFINDNGVEIFARNFVKPLFANPQHPAITFAENLALKAKKDTVTAYLQAMRDRPDRSKLLNNSPVPLLVIAGEKDQVIQAELIEQTLRNRPATTFTVLADVGHMGMFEATKNTQEILSDFLEKNSYQAL
jgi:pimeloyl-ACP methyl ester carboxylesterase